MLTQFAWVRAPTAITITALALVSVSGTSCGGDTDPRAAAGPVPTMPANVEENPESGANGGLPALMLETLDLGLPGEKPIMARSLPPGSGLLVADQAGLISRVLPGESHNVLDIRDRVRTRGREEGLLGLAVAPEFPEEPHLYVYYSASDPRRTVLSRFALSVDELTAKASSEQLLLEIEQPFANHNGGMIEFGPDGFIYIGVGDGGGAGDPSENGQNPHTLLGSILRINVRGNVAPYSIPPGNPFVDGGEGRPEVWAHGVRNPWRFSFDAQDGGLWLGDVGQNRQEEIDLVTVGGNYGWNITEGDECFQRQDCDRSMLVEPLATYGRDEGCSVTGGYVYRGPAIPDLHGVYLFGDFCSGKIWGLLPGSRSRPSLLLQGPPSISSFALDADGEILVLSFSMGIQRIIPAP